jgi:hypothetical protein
MKMNIDDIPAEKRWELATRSATSFSLIYDLVFRRTLGERYEEINLPIGIERGRDLKRIALAMGLSAGDAQEIGETYSLVSSILLGPELKAEISRLKGDQASLKITSGPLFNRAVELGMYPGLLLSACQAYGRSAIENLNPRYKYTAAKQMCAGDENCESLIGEK